MDTRIQEGRSQRRTPAFKTENGEKKKSPEFPHNLPSGDLDDLIFYKIEKRTSGR